MHISDEGFDLIKKFEGCELEAYKCAAGVWTIGYGHTKDVQEGDTWGEEKAEFMLWRELEDEYEHYVNSLVTVPMNQCQFDALVSWVYNLGPANLKVSTLLKKLNAGDYEDVPNQIKRWNKATVNGERKVLAGLTRRREAEALMFEGKPWDQIINKLCSTQLAHRSHINLLFLSLRGGGHQTYCEEKISQDQREISPHAKLFLNLSLTTDAFRLSVI